MNNKTSERSEIIKENRLIIITAIWSTCHFFEGGVYTSLSHADQWRRSQSHAARENRV
jgi:hypothetical protein